MVFFEYLGRKAVAGCPIVDVGQKFFGLFYRFIKIFYVFNKKAVQIVFFKILVRHVLHKVRNLFRLGLKKLFCKFMQDGSSDAYHRIFVNIGNQLFIKVFVLFIFKEKSLVWISVCFVFIKAIIPLFLIFVEEKRLGLTKYYLVYTIKCGKIDEYCGS